MLIVLSGVMLLMYDLLLFEILHGYRAWETLTCIRLCIASCFNACNDTRMQQIVVVLRWP